MNTEGHQHQQDKERNRFLPLNPPGFKPPRRGTHRMDPGTRPIPHGRDLSGSFKSYGIFTRVAVELADTILS